MTLPDDLSYIPVIYDASAPTLPKSNKKKNFYTYMYGNVLVHMLPIEDVGSEHCVK